MLEKMPGGEYHFEISVILRNAMLISSLLTNSEVWYGVTKEDTDQLEQIDEMWIRNLFECSRNVPKDLLYLELGLVPISFMLKGIEDIDLNINRKWNNEIDTCLNCPQQIMDQRHLLECKYLSGKNEIISYIPTYEDLFTGNIEDQIYISRILKENLSILKAKMTT